MLGASVGDHGSNNPPPNPPALLTLALRSWVVTGAGGGEDKERKSEMSRELKRVPMDFDWPLNKVWKGYLCKDDYDPLSGDGYQVWETVSEGSPISPVFETSDKLVNWLVNQGYSESASQKFLEVGWCPSGLFTQETGFVSNIATLDFMG
jgi:hypothetical protein